MTRSSGFETAGRAWASRRRAAAPASGQAGDGCPAGPERGTVLVVADDHGGTAPYEGLAGEGYRLWRVRSGRAALRSSAACDLVLLDLEVRDMDGFEACRRIRACNPSTVIVIVSERTDEIDVVVGIEVGADDYLLKPVRRRELAARVAAHLRRTARSPAGRTIRLADLTLDLAVRRCHLGPHDLEMRARPFALLARLAADHGRVLTRRELMHDVWDQEGDGSSRTLNTHIRIIRRQLTTASARTGLATPRIVTVRGIGYRLESPTGRPTTGRRLVDGDR